MSRKQRKVLIADSGSTKTLWSVCQQNHQVQKIKTKGINPYYQSEESIIEELTDALLSQLECKESIESLFFYGAGCTTDKSSVVRNALMACFPDQTVEVNSDMLGAARSVCAHESGIVCIMGTGSNSCFYDGEGITANVPPLGFILGDEGSGAVLGKQLVADLLKGVLDVNLKEQFLEEHGLTQAEIIDRVYRQPYPNRFLASFSPFIKAHLADEGIYSLVSNSFKSFLQRNVMQYDYQQYPTHFMGSVAYNYKSILMRAANELGLYVGSIVQDPMEGLLYYHRLDCDILPKSTLRK